MFPNVSIFAAERQRYCLLLNTKKDVCYNVMTIGLVRLVTGY